VGDGNALERPETLLFVAIAPSFSGLRPIQTLTGFGQEVYTVKRTGRS
jgi:hypothetical protein